MTVPAIPWLSVVGIFLSAIFKKAVERVFKDARHKKRQKEADRAAHDPAGAIADHFGGRVYKLPDEHNQTNKANN